jgi:hypothetical protein
MEKIILDKNTLAEIESIVKIIAIIIGAIWVYFKFIRTRENHPKIEFNVDVKLLGRQDGKILIEVLAELENKGLVRHLIKKFSCNVLILKSTDSVVHGDEKINNQLLFEKYNPVNLQTDNKQERINLIIKDWCESFIDSGIKQHYTYLTDIPDSTTFVSIYSQFYYKNNDFQTAQRTFSIKQLEKNNGC